MEADSSVPLRRQLWVHFAIRQDSFLCGDSAGEVLPAAWQRVPRSRIAPKSALGVAQAIIDDARSARRTSSTEGIKQMQNDNKFSMIPARIEPGVASADARFGCVLSLCVKRNDGKTWGGSAVLITPTLAVTTSHCVSQWQPNLHVVSALTNQSVAVKTIHWKQGGQQFTVGGPIGNYPGRRMNLCDEDLVVLELAGPVAATTATPQEPPLGTYVVEIAADVSGPSGSVMVATLQVVGSDCGLATAIEFGGNGFPYASGAPALLQQQNASVSVLVGIQVGVTQPTGRPSPGSGVGRQADLMPLTAERIAWLDNLAVAPVTASSSRSQSVARPASVRTGVPRQFVIQREDGSLHSENDCLVEIDDLNLFHGCAWNLTAAGSLHLLTTNGTLWTRRVPGTNQIKAQVLIYDVGPNQGVAVDVDLVLIEHGGANLWLMGTTYFAQSLVYIYVYRTTDDPDTTQKYRKRVRIEAYAHDGAHMEDRPEKHRIVFNGCDLIESLRLANSKAVRDGDPVQDDVANGHEGHKR